MSSGGEAVVHEGGADAARVLGPVLRDGRDRGADVVLTCAGDRAAALLAAVGGARLVPPQDAWRRSTDAITTMVGLAETAAQTGRELFLVSDCEFGEDPLGWSEWARFEAASHYATGDLPVRRFCLLDTRAPAEVLAAAERLHPVVRRDGTVQPSATYADAAASVVRDGYVAADPLEAEPPALTLDEVGGAADLPAMRHALAAEVERHGLPEWRAYELVLAVGEVVANAVRHGRPPVRVRLWAAPRRLLVTVTDLGSGFDFPLSCYLGPADGRGFGLYLARQLVDQMNICWTPRGFTVRLSLVLDPLSGP